MFSYHDSSRVQCGHADDGQTIDAPSGSRWMHDVQEAADDRAERAGGHEPEQRRQRVDHDGGRPAAAGSSGSGHSDEDFDSWTRPSVSSNGAPVGSSGNAAQHARADQRLPVRRLAPVRRA